MKRLICGFLLCLLIFQIGIANADRQSQIMFPMDFIENEFKDYTIFQIDICNEVVTLDVARIRNDAISSRIWIFPQNDDASLYKVRGTDSGRILGEDDLTRENVFEYFTKFCGNDILAAFDVFDSNLPVLQEETDMYGIAVNNRCVDVTWLARIYFQLLPSYTIEGLCIATEFPYEKDYYFDAALRIIKEARKISRLNKAAVYQQQK